MFASDRDARLYAACAEGNIAGIQNYITSSSSMLPIGALNLAIYHLKMEAVNYLVSSGLVDPNEEGPVPLRLLQHAPVGDKSKSGLYETDDSSKYLYGPVPLYRALSVAELERSRTPYKLVSFMHDRLSVEAKTETAREACTFMKTWLRPKKGAEMKEVNKPWMDLQTVKHVFNESNRTQLFDEERGIHSSYDEELKKLFDTLHPFELDTDEGTDERIEVGVFIELMEDLGHEYVFEELQAMVPDLDITNDGIPFDYFKFIVTGMYMRVLNQFCEFKDGLNLDLQQKQFNEKHQIDSQSFKILQVLLEIGIHTQHRHVRDEVKKVTEDASNRLTEMCYYGQEKAVPCEKLKFGDFCVLATKLLNWERGNACSQCLQHTAYKINNCFRNGFFVTAHLLLLLLFMIGAVVFLTLAYDKVNTDPTVDAGFQSMVDNWQIKPIIDIKYYQEGLNPLGEGTCDDGWERSPTMNWPGSSAGPCICPNFAMPYTSSSGVCTETQVTAGCVTQEGTSAASVSGFTGTLCFLRGGASPATWISDAYTERPMLSESIDVCPESHTQCGNGVYSDNAMCQSSGIDCPVRRMLMVKGLFNWSTSYSATYPYIVQIGKNGEFSAERKYLAYDQPSGNETAFARHAVELDVSLNGKCSDGTTMTYSTAQGHIKTSGAAVNEYTSSTENCTASTEWFTMDSLSEAVALGNAVNQSTQCSSQTTTTTGRRLLAGAETEQPPDWWLDVVECPTHETKVQTLAADDSKQSEHQVWITDADGTKCQVSPVYADPKDDSDLPPHLRPVPGGRTRLSERAAVQPMGRIGNRTYSPPSFARKLLTDTCDAEVTCNAKMDIVFVMDASGSVGSANYQTMLDFAQLVVEQLPIGPDNVQVGFLVFSLTPTYTTPRRRRVMRRRNVDYDYSNFQTFWQFKLSDYTDKTDMQNAIGSSRYLAASTFTGEAIRIAYEHLFDTDSSSGARDSASGVSKIMIVLTDGYATDFSQWDDSSSTSYVGVDSATATYAAVAKTAGTKIFALGVSGYDASQINGIASDPDSKYATTTGTFSTLVATGFVESLTTDACDSAAALADDIPVSTECCALNAYTYYMFTAPFYSTRTITIDVNAGSVTGGYNGDHNVQGTSADSTTLQQPTEYTDFTTGNTFTWTPDCGVNNMCVMWVRVLCTTASTNFTVTQSEDVTPPVITTYSPINSISTVVDTDTPSIVMTFSEPVKISPDATSSCIWSVTPVNAGNGGAVYLVGDSSDVAYDLASQTVILTTHWPGLTQGSAYEVQIPSFCVSDVANNNFAGLSSGNYRFTIYDDRAPYVTDFNPVQGAIGVIGTDNVVLAFNVPVQSIDDDFKVTLTPADSVAPTLYCYPNRPNHADCKSSISGNTLTLNPTSDLYTTTKMQYTVTVDCKTMGNAYCSDENCGYPATTFAPTTAAPTNVAATMTNVDPYACTGDDASLPIQVLLKSTSRRRSVQTYAVKTLQVSTGDYSEIWTVSGNSMEAATGKVWSQLNAVSINPFDSKAYGMVKVKTQGSYLARFDADTLELVAKLPAWSFSGTFDRSNGYFFIMTHGGGRAKHIYLFKDAFQLSGHSDANTFTSVTDWSGAANYVKYSLTKATTGFADIAPMTADLGDGSGVSDWLVCGGSRNQLLMIRYTAGVTPTFDAEYSFTITMQNGSPWPSSGKGAAWNYQDAKNKDHVYISSNSGSGVVEIDTATFDFAAGTVIANRVGSSDATGNNDGMNCLNAPMPCGFDGSGMMADIVAPIYQFTTKDDAAPWITAYNPAQQATGVPTDSGMVLTFNEEITAQPGKVVSLYSYTVAGDNVIPDPTDGVDGARHITLTAEMAPGGGNTMTFSNSDLGGALKNGNRYYVNFPANAVKDDGDLALYNGLNGATGQYQFTVVDTTPPVIVDYSPANGATEQPTDLTFTFTFYDSTTMTMVDDTQISLYKASGSSGSYTYSYVDTINLLDSAHATMHTTVAADACPYSNTANTLDPIACDPIPVRATITFKFSAPLESSTTYSVVMNGVMRDTSNTDFEGLQVGTYLVTTADQIAPWITVYNPLNGASNIMSRDLKSIVLTFNENIQAGACTPPCLTITKTQQRIKIATDHAGCSANPSSPDTDAPTTPFYVGMTITSTAGGIVGQTASVVTYPATDDDGITDYCSIIVNKVGMFEKGQSFAGNLQTMTVDDPTQTSGSGRRSSVLAFSSQTYTTTDTIIGKISGARASVVKVNGGTPDVLTSDTFIANEEIVFSPSGAYGKFNSIATSASNPSGTLLNFVDGASTYPLQKDVYQIARNTESTTEVSYSADQMTIHLPDGDYLSAQTSYTIHIANGAVKDTAATPNNFDGLPHNYTFMTSALVPSPSEAPTLLPSWSPTVTKPTSQPITFSPTTVPTEYPSAAPTSHGPTAAPTWQPTTVPSKAPSKAPTTFSPTVADGTFPPSSTPTTFEPTETPSWAPSPAPTSHGPTTAPTEYPSSAPTTVGPTGGAADCQVDDTLCDNSARTVCDTAEAFADDATNQFSLQFSREAKWTPDCKAGNKDTVYTRRSTDERPEEGWQEEMFMVHIPMFALLIVAAFMLEIYAYYKIQGTLCFPAWMIHVIRLVAIVLAALLLFYCILMFFKVYDEYKYYDNVISDSCTDMEYEPPFVSMRDSMETMYQYDFMVVLFDFLVLLWFLSVLACMSVKIYRSFNNDSWSCWQAYLPEYEPAGNGLSQTYFKWDADLPEETGLPCANTQCTGCGGGCVFCTASPNGPRIDIDVLGARRRMYQKDYSKIASACDEKCVEIQDISPVSKDQTMMLGSSSTADAGHANTGAGTGIELGIVVAALAEGPRMIQGAPPIVVPHTLLPKSEEPEEDAIMDEQDKEIATEPWDEDPYVLGFSHATVALSAAETWQISDNKIVNQSAHAQETFGAAEPFDELKDRLTEDSQKALDDALDAARAGQVTSDLVLKFKEEPDGVGSDSAGPDAGATAKKKRKSRKAKPGVLDDEDVPLSELFKMLEPESMELLYNTVNDLALQGEFDDALNAVPAQLRNEMEKIAGENNAGLPAGGSSQRNKKKRNNTPTDWLTCPELQSLLGNPAVDAFDAKVRQVLQDQDLELYMADMLGNSIDLEKCDLLDFAESLQPLTEESRNMVLNTIRDNLDGMLLDDAPWVEDQTIAIDGAQNDQGKAGRKKPPRKGRPVNPEDVMACLQGGECNLTDESKCELERFIREKRLLSSDDFKCLPIELLDDGTCTALTVGITPMMKFGLNADTQPLIADSFMIDGNSDLVFQLRAGDSGSYNIIDANATAITALDHRDMRKVVGKSFDDFLFGDESEQLLHDSIIQAIERAQTGQSEAVELMLDMKTRDCGRIRVQTKIMLDPNQDLSEHMDGLSPEQRYLPMLNMKLVPRPIWELVQNGPVLVTTRPTVGSDWGGNDMVTFCNDRALDLLEAKQLPAALFKETKDKTRNPGCFDLSSTAVAVVDNNSSLKRAFQTFYADGQEPERMMEDICLGNHDHHSSISALAVGPVPTEPAFLNLTMHATNMYGVLVDASGSVIFATDMKGRIIDMNGEATDKLTGEGFEDGNLALDHIGRHYTRYIDSDDRQCVVSKFNSCLKSGKPKTFDQMVTMTSSDFTFDMQAATYDLSLSLQMYPHFDKYGKVAGVVFEGQEVSLIKLEADVAKHIFSYEGEPLEYDDDVYNELYDADEMDLVEDFGEYGCNKLRKCHAPVLGLDPSGRVDEVTHAALMTLGLEDSDDALERSFIHFLDQSCHEEFKAICELVKAQSAEPIIMDAKLVGQVIPTRITISPWYDNNAKVKGILVNFSDGLAAFEMDSDGYVLDCTPAAARALGYTRSDIIGKALISLVDDDSCVDALDTLSELLFEEELVGENKVVRIDMQRQTKRVIQTTWDAVRLDKDKDVAVVVMHKEKLTNKVRRQGDMGEMDSEEVKLRAMVPLDNRTEADKEKVELTAVEKARLQTEPVKYHYVVMQEHNQLDGECDFDSFRKYLAAVWQEQRPWELHRLNVYMKSKLQKVFAQISRGQETMDYAAWEEWWNISPNRVEWDGGVTMTHLNPPGRIDPFDYDKKR